MLERREWAEFKDSKLLWWINRSLHIFGWAIVYSVEKDGSISEVYPARTSYRGFSSEDEAEGFIGLTEYVQNNIYKLVEETRE